MIKIAKVLNKAADVERFTAKKKVLSRAVHETFYNQESAAYATGVQIDLAYPLIMGIYVFSSIWMILSIFFTDLTYAILDPRVEY